MLLYYIYMSLHKPNCYRPILSHSMIEQCGHETDYGAKSLNEVLRTWNRLLFVRWHKIILPRWTRFNRDLAIV